MASLIRRNKTLPAVEQLIEDLKVTEQESNKYKFVKCTTKNIVLIGRTRTGKSTIAKIMENPIYVPVTDDIELYSSTKKIEIHAIAAALVKPKHDEIQEIINFNVIDTPGFYDIVPNQAEVIRLSNADIKALIDTCISKDLTQIHLFAFVFTAHGGINDKDIESMTFVKENYPQLSDHMALIITHCEQNPENNNDKLIEQFFRNKAIPPDLKNYFGLGFKFMGCIRHESLRERNEQALGLEIEHVMNMREKFIEFCTGLKEFYNIHYDFSSREELSIEPESQSLYTNDRNYQHGSASQKPKRKTTGAPPCNIL